MMKLLFSATLTYDPEVLVSLRLAFPVLFSSSGAALDGTVDVHACQHTNTHTYITYISPTDDEPGSVGQFVLPSTLKEKIIVCDSEKRVRNATSALYTPIHAYHTYTAACSVLPA